MGKNFSVLEKLQGGLIVSCQALEDEPLHSSQIMAQMACAAMQGGAVGIRANTPEDITEIKKKINIPIIGLYKKNYEGSEVYITPTMQEVDALMEVGASIIAMDATNRLRPTGERISTFFERVHRKYPDMLFMADCAELQDGIRAQELGFDLVGTTLCGYTRATRGTHLPSFSLLSSLARVLRIPLIAEGGIWEPGDLKTVFTCGAYAAVVGSAITRPLLITKRFVEEIH